QLRHGFSQAPPTNRFNAFAAPYVQIVCIQFSTVNTHASRSVLAEIRGGPYTVSLGARPSLSAHV
ncbi:MAG: hypothetical protein WA517_00005, partial [Candidatus Acidiferrum sp.]